MKFTILLLLTFSTLSLSRYVSIESHEEIGDMIFPKGHAPNSIGSGNGILKNRNAITWKTSYWTNGKVPYYISSGFDLTEEFLIMDALNEMEFATDFCIDFYRIYDYEADFLRSNNEAFISVRKHKEECSSFIGRVEPDQVLYLANWCVNSKQAIKHEFMHALGFFHEQNRIDRDKFVTIHYENMQPGMERQFGVFPGITTSKYDTKSVMHYGPYSGSKNGEAVMTPKNPNDQIINYGYLSPLDIEDIRKAYKCY